MIDVHCHILPGIDDGPRDMEQSLAVAKTLTESGFRHVIATPHAMDGIYNAEPAAIRAKTAELNQALKIAGLDLTVYPGAEYPLRPELLNSDPVTLNNSRYILVELPFGQPIPRYAEDLFFQLQAGGLIPILAHPERCWGILERPGLVRAYAESGVMMQVTIASFFGRYGKEAGRLVRDWLKHGLVRFLASDSHRPFAYDLARLKQELGESAWDRLLTAHPAAVISNEEQPAQAMESRGKALFKPLMAFAQTNRF